MRLHSGIPLLAEARRQGRSDLCRELSSFDEEFVAKYRSLFRRSWLRWGSRPTRNWSRRWEYAYVAQRLTEFAAARAGQPLEVLDAGSGVTFFPYYLCDRLEGARVLCCDRNAAYDRAFRRIAKASGCERVRFVPATLEDLPVEPGSLDAIYCISVLEHTGDYGAILDEFRRALREGGLLVLTFDISLDGRAPISPDAARTLLEAVLARFEPDPDLDPIAELGGLEHPDRLLTTDAFRRADPARLPWRWPRLKSVYDLLHGRGWTGGFFSTTVYCLAARAPEARRP